MGVCAQKKRGDGGRFLRKHGVQRRPCKQPALGCKSEGREELLHQISDYATAAVTPGATARVEAVDVLLEFGQKSVAILLE